MNRNEWVEIRDILSGKTERFDEMGFPDDGGEYDIYGWPLPITDWGVAMAKSKTVWLTRDNGGQDGITVWNYVARPHKEEDGNWNWTGDGTFENIYPELIRLLGITLAPGQKVKARIVIGE